MLYKVLIILSHLTMIRSSLVVDSIAQKSVYVTDYCPKMMYCAEGAHVMCMYYNNKKKMGPRCSNALNITMTPDLANKLLDVSNAVRSRIANGKERGKDGNLLPRGYGIFRLKWDTELATFAQVLANQCVLRHDLCRATKRFPDPGQTAGLVRFSYPDWFPVSKSGNFTEPGMSPAKLLYATTQILKSWYGQKNSVTPSMITNYPDWTLNPNNQNGRLYLEMIYGSATHMGCGISAYTEYAFYDNNAALNYNSVQIICNYSGRPRRGTAVFNTVPPGDTLEPFSRCGCPVGSESDEECLCQEAKPPIHTQMPLKYSSRQCPEGEVCEPTVVVLPIFTVEDAPPEKLIPHESFANTSLRIPMDDDIFRKVETNLFQSQRKIHGSDKTNLPKTYEVNRKTTQSQFPSQQNIRKMHQRVAIKKRYFDKKHMDIKVHEKQFSQAERKNASLFSRAAKFELPGALSTISIRPIKQTGIKDVVPRKDFSTAKQLVNKYLYGNNDLMKPQYRYTQTNTEENIFDKYEAINNEHAQSTVNQERDNAIFDLQKRKIMKKPLFQNIIHEEKTTLNGHQSPKDDQNKRYNSENHETFNNIIGNHHLHEVFNILNATKPLKMSKELLQYQNLQRSTTETVLNNAEQKVISQDSFFKQLVSNTYDYRTQPMNSVTEETDNKLMDLLDILEQEVKHVQLRDKDKQLFDAKIRKIYGKVVGKSVNLLDFNINKDTYTKSNDKYNKDDVQDSNVIKKSVQHIENAKYRIKKDGLDDHNSRRLERNFKDDKYRNDSMTKSRYEDKYEEKNLRYNLRGLKHGDLSHEQMRNRYRDDDNDRELGDRKTYRNYDFDRNAINEGDLRYRGTENKHPDRYERDRHHRDDEFEHQNENELDHRSRNKFEHHRKDDIGEELRSKNYYLNNDANDDPLSVERRRFYQEKLDNIERKLQLRNHKRRKDNPRHMRPMRPATRKSENQMNIYGRARFAHGY